MNVIKQEFRVWMRHQSWLFSGLRGGNYSRITDDAVSEGFMVRASVRFKPYGGLWMEERDAVGFSGETDLGTVEFLITTKALIQLLNPGLTTLGRDAALETFVEFEADIHRIAQRELVKRLGGEPPIVITAADVQG